MSKVWTILFIAVLVVGGGFLVGCSSGGCDVCGKPVPPVDPCTCGAAPFAPAPGPVASCGGGGGS